MAPHSSTLAWKIPWTEEPGRLQSMGSWRVRHNWATSLSLFSFMHWRRQWQPTPVFLPEESQEWGSWWIPVYGVAQSRTWLKRLSSTSNSSKVIIISPVFAEQETGELKQVGSSHPACQRPSRYAKQIFYSKSVISFTTGISMPWKRSPCRYLRAALAYLPFLAWDRAQNLRILPALFLHLPHILPLCFILESVFRIWISPLIQEQDSQAPHVLLKTQLHRGV